MSDIFATLEQDGESVLKLIITDSQAFVAWIKQEGTEIVADAEKLLADVEDAGKSFFAELESMSMQIVPKIAALIAAGKTDVAIVETDLFNTAAHVLTSLKTDGEAVASTIIAGLASKSAE